MDVKKLVPWNWFKKEEEDSVRNVPVRHSDPQGTFYSPLMQLHQEIDRIFDNMFRTFAGWPFGGEPVMGQAAVAGILKPTVDIAASDREYTISVEVPGVDEKDIQLELAGNTLTIRGEKKKEHEEKNKNFYRMERAYGAFQRVLSLPEDADQDSIEASFKKGVLTITIPRKAQPQAETKKIEIRKAA